MIILSLDTTTRAGSAAVLRGDDVLAQLVGDPASPHGQRLPGDLGRVLDLAGVALRDVELFAVAAGPGSFTGLRVGIATMQGLAMASGARVAPVSTLDALARAGTNATRLVGAWMDAQRGEVYAALYAPDGEEVRLEAVAARPQVVLDAWAGALASREVVFIGDGAMRYSALIGQTPAARRDGGGAAGARRSHRPDRGPRSFACGSAPRGRPDLRAQIRRGTGARPSYRRLRRRSRMADPAWTIERLTSEADLDAVAALEAESFANPWTRDMLARELGQSDVARVYVLRMTDARLAAFCACWLVFDELHVNTVAVTPSWRRRGLATALMQHVLADAARDGAEQATLEVRRSNEPALELYRRLGFAVEAVRPRYYTSPEEDALILWRRDLRQARFHS